MNQINQGITIDPAGHRAHPFMRRRLADAAMMHLTDGLMLFLAIFVGDSLLLLFHGIPIQMERMLFLIPVWWIGTWFVQLVPGWGLGTVEELRRIELLLVTVFAGVAVALFLGVTDRGGSRITFLSAYVIAAVLVPVGRSAMKQILAAINLWGVPVSIYGDRESVPEVAKALRSDRAFGFIPQAVLSDDYGLGDVAEGVPVLGGLHNTTRRTPMAVVALPHLEREKLIELLEGPLEIYRTILLIPDLKCAPSLWVKPCDLKGILGLELRRNLLDPMSSFCKNFAEWILVFLTLPIWGPLCLFLMLLVWLHDLSAPVYAQTRLGKNGRLFKAYKLRTMVPDAESVLLEKLSTDPVLKKEWEKHYKLKQDPRITLVGKFLRKTSLDEIPQLWCVLIGKMALVGPRPLPDYHHNELELRTQRLRMRVRPGITGLWQVSGRSDSGTTGMDRWDTYYVTNWSVWLDIVILARTLRVVLFGSGAY
ncbi:exopolysaccharide biosynthesis polyprenyl glycosylphosphotransferase [Tichowtungia aerotolerans]|uniref:Exopolysaccharide biosynthesis polyprenyl glycosylphosphotransferase n=1 Tax=Tichowtungia aerotolerans TaxID=2697043 RepID=A0A6P1M5W6_9BACT|nr:exopolysaccharide biosynthesis polyprenyl glycosylphosphotransferase [Tichowtungia aerotolerans]QHI70199.1 exopolysaccharide biosynthesis polyprenyl glycosylphosphotransferase [Tichowtungia aerotolerans]